MSLTLPLHSNVFLSNLHYITAMNGSLIRRYFYHIYYQLDIDIFFFLVSLICIAVVAVTSHSGNGLKKTRGFQHL